MMKRTFLRRLRLAIVLIGLPVMFDASAKSQERTQIAVDVAFVGDDGLSQRFQSAVEKAITRRMNLRLATGQDVADISVRSESNVDWDKVGGREVAIYRVLIKKRGWSHEIDKLGVCYSDRMEKCGTDIATVLWKLTR